MMPYLRRNAARPEINIGKEIELLTEIEDIKDELGILQMVLEDQRDILRSVNDVLGGPINNRVLEGHMREVQRMTGFAEKTSKLVSLRTTSSKVDSTD